MNCGEQGASWKTLENDWKSTVRARNVGIFCQGRARAKRFREEAEERQAGMLGQQLESPVREYLEPVKCCNDADCTHRMMKRGFFCVEKWRVGEYKITFRTEVKATGWAFDRMKEAFEQVAKDEARKLSTVQEIMIRSTDWLRLIIAPAGSKEA